MAVCGVVLAALCPAAAVTGLASPPIFLDSLSTAPGGGAALDDWLAAVVAGGDAGAQGGHEAQEERAGEGNVEEEEEEEERGAFLVPGAWLHQWSGAVLHSATLAYTLLAHAALPASALLHLHLSAQPPPVSLPAAVALAVNVVCSTGVC